MPCGTDLGQTLAAAARRMHEAPTLLKTGQAIADAARESIPGIDHVGISMLERRRKPVTVAASGALVSDFDALQFGMDEGPGVEVLCSEFIVAASNIRHERRWPRYVREAVKLGLRSQLAVRLYLDGGGTLGGLNMYSTLRDEIDPGAESMAELFAAHSAVALDSARQIEGLNQALRTRKVIGQASGILMERYELDEEGAFAFLLRASSHANVKLRDVAHELVSERRHRKPAG